MRYLFSFALSFSACFCSNLRAASLSETRLFTGQRIGVVLSTFDPVTEYHNTLIEAAYKTNRFDYIIVIPSDFTPQKPGRLTMNHRIKMLELRYEESPHILTASPYANSFPQSRRLIKKLIARPEALQLSGILLLGDIEGSKIKQSVLNFLLPVHDWLVATPKGVNGREDALFGKAVYNFELEQPRSSKHVRKEFLGNRDFFNLKSTTEEMEEALAPKVRDYILSNKLYFKKSFFCSNLLTDIWRSK